MTKHLPFKDNTFDSVFSCGVFEYFTDEQIKSILREAFRISKKRVIIMVPNALSIPYRMGMWYMRMTKNWPWGGERPFVTLKSHFKAVGATRISEFSVGTKHSLNFLTMRGGETLRKWTARLLNLHDHSNPALFRQGYLLVSVAEKVLSYA